MSSFEKLPTEVLENIFLFSMNLGLPRSSPVLAGRLSSNYIYIQTIMRVFSKSWRANFYDALSLEKEADTEADSEVSTAYITILKPC